ncbi:Ig-like domain-containing protein, partial [Marinoscillum furvescens]
NGTLTLNADGSFDYTHDGSETTSDSFTYKVNDGTVNGDTVTVSFTITPQNDAPVAVADAYTFDEGSTNTVVVGTGVLANDSDADGDAITAILVSDVSNGTLTLNADGSFSYTHDGSETTSDSFTYKVNDGTVDGNTVTVSLTINPVNDAPVAVADSYTFDEGSTNNVAAGTGVLANDSDTDGDAITAILVSDVSNGTLTLNADGSFSYTHDGSETTSDSFTYKVNDGTVDGNTVTVSLTINPVNDAPVAVADSYTFDEGSTNNVAAGTGVLANDSDADGDAITAVLVSDVSNGTLTLNADGSFTYTHDGSATTSDSFTYKVNDGTVDGNTVTVDITINPAAGGGNTAPVAVADAYTVENGSTNNITAASGVLANDSDADGDAITAILVSDVSNGTLTLNADGSFDYTHDGSETTSDSFTYKVNDGTVDGNTVTVTLTITPQNDAPVAVADAYTFDEGSSNTVAVATGVLANDSDADGDAITAILVSDVSNGTLTLNADGSFDYTHDGSETTSDSFTYKVNDGTVDGNTVTVDITINTAAGGGNTAPVAVADAYTVENGSTNNITAASGVLTNDSDADGDVITAILVSDVSNGTLTLNADGSFTYIHDGSATTSDSFTYKVNDGTEDGNTVTVDITINPAAGGGNTAPVAVADAYTVENGSTNNITAASGVLANDSDADGDAITAILVSGVTNGTLTLNANGSFTYTHDGSATTSDSFTYKVNDGTEDGNTVTVDITINPAAGGGNTAPVAVADAYSVENGSTNNITAASGVLANDSDADGDVITAILVSDVSNGTLTLNADGSFTYTHDGSATTSDSFTYKVNDGTEDGNTVTVDITINPAAGGGNTAPVAVADAYSVENGSTNNITAASGVLANDSDADGDVITAILVSDVSNGTLTLNADGSFTYTHDGSATTSDSFTYKVNDGTEDGNTVTVDITINPAAGGGNTAPVAVADAYSVENGSTNNITAASGVLANDSDADGDVITAILVSDVSNGTLTLNADGSFTYIHDGSATTSDSFTYKVNDGTEDGNTVTVDITINAAAGGGNTAPVAVADTYTVENGSTNNITAASGVLANDSDADGDAITAILVSGVTNGTLTFNADGSFTYTHDGSATTSDSFTYKANDGELDGNTVTVTITINAAANAAPIADDENEQVLRGGTVVINIADGDWDPDGDLDINTITLMSEPQHGMWAMAGGMVEYTHDGSESDQDQFTYQVYDKTGLVSNLATVTIDILEGNQPPVANDDAAAVSFGEVVLINVAENDQDPDGKLDLATIEVVDQPSFGTVSINNDGTVAYLHEGDQVSTDQFTYTIRDEEGNISNVATVTITIRPEEDEPVEVPNAFTPDGDGVNDTWEIPDIVKYPNNMVKVFNRWGNKVAEIKGYNNTTRVWDATAEVQYQLGNEKVPAGTYFYMIDLGDGKETLSGFVVVSR